MKFNRSVKVEITPKKANGVEGKKITIEGLRVKFNVQKTLDAALNTATIDIYNMNSGNRGAVSFKYNLYQALDKAVGAFGGRVDLIAGYKGDEKLLFSGEMTESSSPRDGSEYITRINAKTKAEVLTKKRINKTYPKGTTYSTIIGQVINEAGESPGAEVQAYINQIAGTTKIASSETIKGNLAKVISDINRRFDGKISMSMDERGISVHGSGISGQAKPKFFYNKYSGLIGAASIGNQGADLKVNLEPNIRVSDLIFIESSAIIGNIEPLYVVRSINHIGDSREGEFVTTLNTWFYSAASTIPRASNG